MNHRIVPLLLAAALSIASLSGCSSMRSSADDAVAWVRGALQTNLDAPLARATKATTAGLQDMKFDSIVTKEDVLSANVTARTAKDEAVEVTLTPVGGKLTRIDIRVGLLNDKTAAYEVLAAVKKRI